MTPEKEQIQTLIFMDFETAGPYLNKRTQPDGLSLSERVNMIESAGYTKYLANLINSDGDLSQIPRIAEMSFLVVPRCLFEEAAENMIHRLDSIVKASEKGSIVRDGSINVNVTTNVYTCQLNPELNEHDWGVYERTMCSNRLRRSELQRKNTFSEEWRVVHQLLSIATKPACLIAHNGIEFDFRILFHELKRTNMLSSHPIPEGIYFIDSLLTFVSIEKEHHQDVRIIANNMEWNFVAQHSVERSPSSYIENTEYQEQTTTMDNDGDKDDDNDDDIQYIGSDCQLAEIMVRVEQTNSNKAVGKSQTTNDVQNDVSEQEEDEITVLEIRATKKEGTERYLMKRKALDGLELENDHPFRFMRRNDWCPAKRVRVPKRIFNKDGGGKWYFSEQMSEICLKQAGRYKLEKMFEKIIRNEYKAHRAQPDCEALLQVSMAYGNDFLNFSDAKYAKFPSSADV